VRETRGNIVKPFIIVWNLHATSKGTSPFPPSHPPSLPPSLPPYLVNLHKQGSCLPRASHGRCSYLNSFLCAFALVGNLVKEGNKGA
jgi:hypothetical protein